MSNVYPGPLGRSKSIDIPSIVDQSNLWTLVVDPTGYVRTLREARDLPDAPDSIER
jgi:hypothetical protein